MKKTIKVAALMLVLVMTVFVFASCGNKPKGTYKNDTDLIDTTYEFKGNDYTCTVETTIFNSTTTTTSSGTFEVNELEDGSLEIVFTKVDGDTTSTSSFSFVKGDDFIQIGGTTYVKQ